MAPSPPTPTAPKTITDFFARPAKRLRAGTAAPTASLSSNSSPSSLSPEQRRRVDTNLALARARRNLRLAESKAQASGGAPKLEELLVEETWAEALHGELRKPYALELCRFVAHERLHGPLPVYPPPHLVFHALNATPFDRVKAVIIGQDPYHGPGQAMGLSFSVPEGIKIPSSLGNIFKELEKDLGCTVPSHGNLERWDVQGVLMLNTVLTGADAGEYDTKWLNLRNACSYKVWPGITSGAGSAVPLDSTGFELAPGESRAMPVPSGWSGLVWARSLCSFATDSSGKFSCMTGDCGSGKQDCDGGGPAPPVTIAQFTLGVAGGAIDVYAVSLVDGFNLPMLVTPEGATAGGNCAPAGCVVDLNGACPPVLRVSSAAAAAAGAVVACKSACQAFGGLPQYCCTGEFGNPDSCRPSSYSELMKEACPRAVTYAYDAVDTMFRCGAGGIGTYTVTFCQASTSSSGRPCTTNPTSQIPETTSNTAGGGGQMSEPWRIVLAVAVLGLVSAALAVLEIFFKIFSRCFC